LLCKNIIVAQSKEVKTGSNLAESSKEGYGSERTDLPLMMMMMMTNRNALYSGDAICGHIFWLLSSNVCEITA
jgi:hypothetical protein